MKPSPGALAALIEPASVEPPDEPIAAHLGERIRSVRQSRNGWSLRELAHRSGIDKAVISRIESGKNFTMEVLWRVASALQAHWADLVDDLLPGPPPTTSAAASDSFEHDLAAFGARVFELRAMQHISQNTVADRAGFARTTMAGIETGTQNIKLDTLFRLAAALGVRGCDLLDDRDVGSSQPEPKLHHAFAHAAQLRMELEDQHTELERLRSDLTLAQARAQVAESGVEQAAAKRISSAGARVEVLLDRPDRPRLAAMNTTELAAQVEARSTLYNYLDLILRQPQRHGLVLRPELAIVVLQRELLRHLTENALDERMHRN